MMRDMFKEKYHPDFCSKNDEAVKKNIQKRLEVFMHLKDLKWMDNLFVHIDYSENLIRFIDATVILLEGGVDNDLRAVDMTENDLSSCGRQSISEAKKPSKHDKEDKEQTGSKRYSANKEEKKKSGKFTDSESSSGESSSSESSSSSSDSDTEDDTAAGRKAASPTSGQRKRRKSKSASSEVKASKDSTEKIREDVEEGEEPSTNDDDKKNEKSSTINKSDDAEDFSDSEKKDSEKEVGEVEPDEDAPTPTTAETPVVTKMDDQCDSPQTLDESQTPSHYNKSSNDKHQTSAASSGGPPPRPLHKTYSIFLRSLNADITREELETLCRSYSGFMRLALHDPSYERKFTRRGWITFDRSVNIKEICWNLNNMRLKDCDLGAIVNRELTQRIRPILFLANHKPVMRQDIKFAAKLVAKLDAKQKMWQESSVGEDGSGDCNKMMYSIVSKNPLMKNITDYLVDEGNYEEEVLLGKSSESDENNSTSEVKIEYDSELATVLDRLILYLRVVHSVDFYSATEYPNEDEMPHKCGILHARGTNIMPEKRTLQREVDEYMKNFEMKISHLIEATDHITDRDATKLGLKSIDEAQEAFIQANTQELGKDKWLCPISGKKFKGPDFVRKHILNKHSEKLDVVKKETEFFNNYIRDPRRPQLPEHPSTYSTLGSSRDNDMVASGRGQDYDHGGRSGGGSSNMHSDRGGGGSIDYPRSSPYAAASYREMAEYSMRSGAPPNYYMMRDSYHRSPPPMYASMRDYRSGGGSYSDRMHMDRNTGGGGGNTFYRKYNNYQGNKNYNSRNRYDRGNFNRKMMNYQDLDAPEDDN